jgi:hypothetical protein
VIVLGLLAQLLFGAWWIDNATSLAIVVLPYTGLRDAILAHLTMAEGLGGLFSNVPPRQYDISTGCTQGSAAPAPDLSDQVRSGLFAGGSQIRTPGPTERERLTC